MILKKFIFLTSFLMFSTLIFSQENMNEVTLKDAKGNPIQFSEVIKADKPVIVSFWATWCAPCLQELEAINDVYEEWQKTTGVTLYAVCIDDARSQSKAASIVKSKGWNYEIVYDPNHDLKRILNVVNVPNLLVYYKGNVIYKHSGYSPGSEDILYEKIKSAIKK